MSWEMIQYYRPKYYCIHPGMYVSRSGVGSTGAVFSQQSGGLVKDLVNDYCCCKESSEFIISSVLIPEADEV